MIVVITLAAVLTAMVVISLAISYGHKILPKGSAARADYWFDKLAEDRERKPTDKTP